MPNRTVPHQPAVRFGLQSSGTNHTTEENRSSAGAQPLRSANILQKASTSYRLCYGYRSARALRRFHKFVVRVLDQVYGLCGANDYFVKPVHSTSVRVPTKFLTITILAAVSSRLVDSLGKQISVIRGRKTFSAEIELHFSTLTKPLPSLSRSYIWSRAHWVL